MRLTYDVLRGIDVCGGYLDRFRELFPETNERYVDGVEVTPEVCVEHMESFDWAWAYEAMLNRDGQRQYHARLADDHPTIVAQRDEERKIHERKERELAAWRDRHGERSNYPTSAASTDAGREYDELLSRVATELDDVSARRRRYEVTTFAELVVTPELRSTKLVQALANADQLRENRERERLESAENSLTRVRSRIDSLRAFIVDYQREIVRHEADVPRLERDVATHRVAYNERAVARAERRLPELRDEYATRQQSLESQLVDAEAQEVARIERLRRELAEAHELLKTSTDASPTENVEA